MFGVSDNQTVVGSKFRMNPKDLQSLKKEVADKTTNRLTYVGIHEVEHPDGRVVLFEVPAAPQGLPIAWDGHYYGRDGESLGPLNLEEIERIRRQNNASDWSAITLPSATIDDLDPEAIALARENYIQKNPKFAEDAKLWDTATFLNKAKLTIKGQITRAAILLLGKAEASHF